MTQRGLARFARPAPGTTDATPADVTTEADATAQERAAAAREADAHDVADATAQERAAAAREADARDSAGPAGDDLDLAPALARFIGRRPRPTPGEACEMCATPVADDHRHAVDLERRSLLCVCRGCALLFERSRGDAHTPDHQAADAGPLPPGRYRTVPDRYVQIAPFALPGPAWAALQIPVGIAFVVANTQLERAVAFYPSPGGATESELPLDAWTDIVSANRGLVDVEPDVEAVLLRTDVEFAEPGSTKLGPLADARLPTAQGTFGATPVQDRLRRTGTSTCHIVPVDRCYELVGALRLHWRGFDGGSEVREHIADFFDDVDRRARPQRSQVRT